MSHFTVLVVGENPEDQLAPYQENNMEDCPREYLKFNDIEDEYHQEYLLDSNEWLVDDFGKIYSKYDDKFKTSNEIGFSTNSTYEYPPEYTMFNIPHQQRYSSFEEFMRDWCGYKGRDEETGRYGYWENPNKKWDWYSLGGRWTGFFKLKDYNPLLRYTKGKTGKPGLMTDPAKDGWVDQAYKRDIDFDGMTEVAIKEAEKQYDEFEEAVAGIEPFDTPWVEFHQQYDNLDEARKAYREIPFIKATSKMCYFDDPIIRFKLREENPREAFVKEACMTSFSTFAVIIDGKWYERGEMGWWGVVHDEKDKLEWTKQLHKLLEDTSDDTLFSVYDCHI